MNNILFYFRRVSLLNLLNGDTPVSTTMVDGKKMIFIFINKMYLSRKNGS